MQAIGKLIWIEKLRFPLSKQAFPWPSPRPDHFFFLFLKHILPGQALSSMGLINWINDLAF